MIELFSILLELASVCRVLVVVLPSVMRRDVTGETGVADSSSQTSILRDALALAREVSAVVERVSTENDSTS